MGARAWPHWLSRLNLKLSTQLFLIHGAARARLNMHSIATAQLANRNLKYCL